MHPAIIARLSSSRPVSEPGGPLASGAADTATAPANIGHHADVAGQSPGGYPADAMDLWAEGFRCPAVKLVDGGELIKELF